MSILKFKLPYNNKEIQEHSIIKTHLKNATRVKNLIKTHLKISIELQPELQLELQLKPNEYDLYNSKYISSEIRTAINKLKYHYIISYSLHYKTFNIANKFTIYSTTKNEKNILELANQILHNLLYFNIILDTNKTPNLVVFLTNKKKLLPSSNDNHFGTNNVNTAVTDGTSILITRKEEVIKTIIHECIHYHQMDFPPFNYPSKYNKKYLSKYNIVNENIDIRLSETYTDMIAIVLDAIINSNTPIETLRTNIQFTLFQTAKILNHIGCKTMADLRSRQLVQSSHVFEYYIVKSHLMYNLLDAMSVLSNPNLTFNNNYNALHNFAMNLDKNKKFYNIIDNLISKISKTEIDKSLATTMRMTIV